MDLDDALGNAVFYEEARYFGALVSLQLDDFAFLWVNDDIAIASEFFLECFQKLFAIILFRQVLECREGLATITLLDTNMDVVGLRAYVSI